MKTVANCSTLMEAETTRLLLASYDIEAWVLDSNCASLVPHHFATKAGVRVQVLEENEEAAQKIIQNSRSKKEDVDSEEN